MKKILLLLALFGSLLIGVFFYLSKKESGVAGVFSQIDDSAEQESGFHTALHMDKFFYGDLDGVASSPDGNERIYGGITSHHLLVAKEIAGFFSSLGSQGYKTVVILGPNHFNAGKGDVLVSGYSYRTPWGTVSPDKKYIDELIARRAAYSDEDPFSEEHSISALVGFVKYYLPDAKIVPIIMKRNAEREKAEFLAASLKDLLADDAIVISSVDFSHHLDRKTSQFHDAVSLSAIRSFDYGRLMKSEIDSPVSVYALLKYLESKEAQKMTYKNINSADFMRAPLSEDVTSYAFAKFTKGDVESDGKFSLLSFGDMMLTREVGKSIRGGLDPFGTIKGPEGNFMRGVDFVSANLEGSITVTDDCPDKAEIFRHDRSVVGVIKKSGINLLSLANNHTGDCRERGFTDTESYLSESKIDFFGSPLTEKSYTEKEVNGKKIVFLGIDAIDHAGKMEKYYELIKQLRDNHDYLVVNMHWGYEYHTKPSLLQEEIAHSLIDSGADLIIGHHPHVVQPVEIYKDKAIFYSLGNFVFDQAGEKVNEGIGVGTVFGRKSIGHFIFPYVIEKYQPALISPEKSEIFCNQYLQSVSDRDGCHFEIGLSQDK